MAICILIGIYSDLRLPVAATPFRYKFKRADINAPGFLLTADILNLNAAP